ncbi:MAG: hypothetical protein ABEJ57_06470 [Halobacteriaceae archaeon]
MSNTTAHDASEKPQRPIGSWWRETLHRPVQTVSFWAAVGLPVLYVPLLLASPVTAGDERVVAALVTLHAMALLLGHSYDPN